MKQIPILFSPPMIQAIFEGRKKKIRRLMPEWCNNYSAAEIVRDPELCDPKAAKFYEIKPKQYYGLYACFDKGEEHLKCKYDVGDILWVREAFTILDWWENDKAVQVMYEDAKTAVKTLTDIEWDKFENWGDKSNKKSPLFLFKSLSRLFLKVKSVSVEKLQDISEFDAEKEGIENDIYLPLRFKMYGDNKGSCESAITSFMTLWQSINGPESWDENRWVWVIEFERCKRPENFLTQNK